MREFRVKKVVRYIVTDWADHAGGSCTEVCGPSTLEQANTLARDLGAAHPGSLVNMMEREAESYGLLDIGKCVDRFLAWKLPFDFNPDNGNSYKRPNYHPNIDATPTGTNLLDASQARAMLEHVLLGHEAPTKGTDRPAHAFRKKLIVIEACRWEGCKCGLTNGVGPMGACPIPEGLRLSSMKMPPVARVSETDHEFDGQAIPPGEIWRAGDFLYIGTLEGAHRADPGDWIIRGVKGELYPCKPDIFVATYEAA